MEGSRFPVDIDLLVALAEPGRASHPDAQDRADEMALARRFEEEIVLAPAGGVFLAILGVEIGSILWKVVQPDPVDVVIEEAERLSALVLDLDPGRLAEGHPPEGVVRVPALDDDRNADDLAAPAEAVGEEIAQRRFHRRPGIAVPEDPQHQLLVIGRAAGRPILGLRAEKGDPDMGDHSGALFVKQDLGAAGRNVEVVPIALDIGVSPGDGRGIVPALAAVAVAVGSAAQLTHTHGRGGPHGTPLLGFGESLEDPAALGSGGLVVTTAP